MALLKLFGGGTQQKKPQVNPQVTIEKLRGTIEMLEKREKYLEDKILKEGQTAKANATRNVSVAKMALKRRRAYQNQIEKLQGAKTTLETQIIAIESATTNFAVLDSMTAGANALRQLNRNMDVDQVEETMDEIREQFETHEEIATAIATPLGHDLADDAGLEEELDALVQEELKAQFAAVPAVPTTPLPVASKPTQVAAPAPKTDDEEFEALGAEMGM